MAQADLLILPIPKDPLADQYPPRSAIGPYKLAQRWMLEILTRKGSIPALPERGTDFLNDAVKGHWRSLDDVRASFTAASAQAASNLRNDESDSDPDDEILADVSLKEITSTGDRIILEVAIQSQAGGVSQLSFAVPLIR